MKKIFLILLLSVVFKTNAQEFKVEILSGSEDGVITVCPKTDYEFSAKAFLDGEETEASFVWDFDNGERISTEENSVKYAYERGGAYVVSVKAVSNAYTAWASIKLKAGVSPYFSNYYSDIDNSFNGICLGSKAVLTMPLNDTLIKYRPRNYYSAKTPQTFYSTSWQETITVKNFENQTIISASDIKSVSVRLVHTNSEDLKISLLSPDNKEVVLKDI